MVKSCHGFLFWNLEQGVRVVGYTSLVYSSLAIGAAAPLFYVVYRPVPRRSNVSYQRRNSDDRDFLPMEVRSNYPFLKVWAPFWLLHRVILLFLTIRLVQGIERSEPDLMQPWVLYSLFANKWALWCNIISSCILIGKGDDNGLAMMLSGTICYLWNKYVISVVTCYCDTL